MSIEIGSKWVNYGNQVVVVKFNTITRAGSCVIFVPSTQNLLQHILTEADFLKQYKPYEPVYEYQYAFEYKEGAYINLLYYTDTEALRFTEICQRIDFTKRERK